MDIMLHNHNAKHVCDIPDGLRELCADISREVIRSQPKDIYEFIADYLDTLMITRENAKIAIKVVPNIMLKSEQIVEILSGTGLKLEEIAAAAPRLQKAFRAYLDAADRQKKECGCDEDSDADDESEISICRILKETGATYEEAQCAAIKIQSLFRGHYERMTLAEKRGEVQWQRAAANTMEILRKSGVTQNEASHAAVTIQAAYRGYYTRKNMKLKKHLQEKEGGANIDEQIDIATWLDMMLENTGLTVEQAKKAATIIQTAYRRYRGRQYPDKELISLSTNSSITEREKLGSLNEAAISVFKESDLKRDEIIDSSDDDSEIGFRAVKFHSTIYARSDDNAEIPAPDIEGNDEPVTLKEEEEVEKEEKETEEEVEKEEKETEEEVEKEEKETEEERDDYEIPASDSAGKIRFAELEEQKIENNENVVDDFGDEQDDEQIDEN